MVQYLHFRILEFPLNVLFYLFGWLLAENCDEVPSIFLGWLPEPLKMGISPTGMGFRCDLTISNDVSMNLMRIYNCHQKIGI